MKRLTRNQRKFLNRTAMARSEEKFTIYSNLGAVCNLGLPCTTCLMRPMCVLESKSDRVVFSRSSYTCEPLNRLYGLAMGKIFEL